MKKAFACFLAPVCLLAFCSIGAMDVPLGDAQYGSSVEQTVILEPTLRPNQSYYMRCTIQNVGEKPIKVAFNVLGAVPIIPARYSLMPKPFQMLGDEVELEGYSAYAWSVNPVVGRQRVAFRVFDPHHLAHLKVTDCYAISISKA